jgi:phenylacetic acid degradation operon negative regulatory protein
MRNGMSSVPAVSLSRPLTARSIIASTLLGTHPPRMSVARLVRSCELFGIRENAARVALSRMVSAGELAMADGRYELIGRLRVRQDRQMQSRRGLVISEAWDQTWRLAIVIGEARQASDRAELRTALKLARFGEWREGVWARPDNGASGLVNPPSCSIVTGAVIVQPIALATSLFATEQWAQSAKMLLRDMEPLHRQLMKADASALTSGFVLNASVLRHLQADPLLPYELLPKQWPGETLRSRYEAFDAAFVALWQRTLRA